MQRRVSGSDAPFEITWDRLGVAHVWAETVADAYRGMGYAAGYERLWQIHLSCAYANGEASALLGERFMIQDAMHKAFNVRGDLTPRPPSRGDWVASAYLDGLNAYVGSLDEVPPEFLYAGAQPRKFTLDDIAARYRFTSWFQHKSWTEKLMLGRLMATHGVEYFRDHALHLSAADVAQIEQLKAPLQKIDPTIIKLAYPEVSVPSLSGSNNWAVTAERSASGFPLLATDPHQPHTIPNTFFYVHLHAGEWDVFGAAFPGVPYFMMGFSNELAWGLTTGFIDCYDLFVEQVDKVSYRSAEGWQPIETRTESIAIKGGETKNIEVQTTQRGVLLEPLMRELDLLETAPTDYQTSLYWSLRDVPTSAGALALLPTARSAEEFGELLFENDICPLVNNIICVDKVSNLQRYIAATTPARHGVTGSVPLSGWDRAHDFALSTAGQLTVERNPVGGISLTANNDTMGEAGDFYIHNFPAHSARADRIRELLGQKSKFTVDDFCDMQLDLTDLRAMDVLPDLLAVLRTSDHQDLRLAIDLLEGWDCQAAVDSAAACIYYPFLDRYWPRRFMASALQEELINLLPAGAPGLNRFDISTFTKKNSPWAPFQDLLNSTICEEMLAVVKLVKQALGDDRSRWRWGDLHQVAFAHRLNKQPLWENMSVGPDEIGGSPTTLGMAMHMGDGPGQNQAGEVPCRVYHGPAYRLVVDLGDTSQARFVIAGGNGGRAGSLLATNHYMSWLAGDYFVLQLARDDIDTIETWSFDT
jgi:penicillin amidase